MKKYDVIIIGAGASGIFAAGVVAKRGKRVAVLDMGHTPLRKVMMSGGGRCNFTNMAAARDRYFGENPDFVRSAITQFSPSDMLDWAAAHNITWVQKAAGQYFCADDASCMVDALIQWANGAKIYTDTTVTAIEKNDDTFIVRGTNDTFTAKSVIVATGGTSFPVAGVSDIGFQIAKHFGHKIIPPRPALCGIVTDVFSHELAGTSMPVQITVGHETIVDAMLFTHFGIGGPATYRATVRDLQNGIHINLMPGGDVYELLRGAKQTCGRRSISAILAAHMPNRAARMFGDGAKNIADYKDAQLRQIADKISYTFIPGDKIKLFGMRGAEVMRGGVATTDISSKTMESKLCPGLFFVGEVLDIAGDLGGFNLHWAWASGYVAGTNA
ncbi:MAG: NAD(P)/FAD-dependent oxidoreductase [Muribaculaceae bacterium]|nr:NAD(P)/FAD-dependent oxidoreductase [Muribaculaceae bacterium]